MYICGFCVDSIPFTGFEFFLPRYICFTCICQSRGKRYLPRQKDSIFAVRIDTVAVSEALLADSIQLIKLNREFCFCNVSVGETCTQTIGAVRCFRCTDQLCDIKLVQLNFCLDTVQSPPCFAVILKLIEGDIQCAPVVIIFRKSNEPLDWLDAIRIRIENIHTVNI